MKLSTRGRYGTRALIELALHEGNGSVSLKEIAANQELSLQYLEHLISPLIAGGLVKSMRGAKGGIRLAKPASEITLADVLGLLEGSNAPVECVDQPEACHRSKHCATRDVWTEVKESVDGILGSVTLEDIAQKQKRKMKTEEMMYYI
jgi:Rrf2 family cysteine metabolism transcriptional repressor